MKNTVLLIIYILTILYADDSYPFKAGEKLHYDVSFAGIKAGNAYLEVIDNNESKINNEIHIRFVAKTSFPFSSVYLIDDQIDTWLDINDLYTKRIKRSIKQGNYKKESETKNYYEESISVTNKDTTLINGFLFDPYSLFYLLRTKPLILGQTIKINTFNGKKITPIQIVTKAEETINTVFGSFNCLVIKPFREGSTLLKNKGDMMIWFSNDKKRLPIQIKIKLQYGSMLLKIKEINL